MDDETSPVEIAVDFELDEKQRKAIDLCIDVRNRIAGVTGAAGTGKTTIMRYVYLALRQAGYRVVLCSPTGKAAKRVKEATSIDALTIHRLLEFGMPQDVDQKTGKPLDVTLPGRGPWRPLDADVVIADEYSMVNIPLHTALVRALKPGGRLLAFGDLNQLRPIEDGSFVERTKIRETPFEALLRKFPSVVLETIHRQALESGIVQNAQRVLKRLAPRRMHDFDVITTNNAVETVLGIVSKDDSWGTIERQIITPMNKSITGTHALNGSIQTILEPNVLMPSVNLPRHPWDAKMPLRVRIGSKVIQTKNDYNINVFNGETGKVVAANPATGHVTVDFGDRSVEYPPLLQVTIQSGEYTRVIEYDPRKDLYLAYAITTHKAQGSEFKHVLYIMARPMAFGQSRANLYTGITRARESVLLVTDSYSLTSVPLKKE